jgi:hypothetical protein
MPCTEEHVFDNSYDFAIVNQHYWVNNWVTPEMVIQFKKPVYCIVTEVTSDENPTAMSPDFYTGYLVLNPVVKESTRVHAFCRPLEAFTPPQFISTEVPIIGSFGFATDGKKWHQIVEQVNSEFDRAIVRFNIPQGTYVQSHIHEANIRDIRELSQRAITKPGIMLEITHKEMTKTELIEWCAHNTINVFFYYRNTCGMSAVTDQAISSGRPLLVTTDPTFRHIHKYLRCYPEIGIRQAIAETGTGVKWMQKNWSSTAFVTKFENILRTSIGSQNVQIQ